VTIELLTPAGRISHAPACRSGTQLTGSISAALLSLLQAPAQPIQCSDDELHGTLVEVARLYVELAAVSARLLEELIARKGIAARPADDQWLTPDQAAAQLGVTPRWIRRRARVLPFVRRISGKTIRISEEGLRRWVAARRTA
jgi:excisionase family DNA binding protein